ncbi:polyketide synthase Pks13 [Nocardia jinanensis]|uniref:Polyketide synthase n=1 Tax=Nocardia jinanensis TaxID=382504 RepID=A0A917RVL2_9NOCA|nr:polyketide synthase Pks13 [Nocardia jinanensis]GGL37341.1 polyketide synthase [Nocardia jinanensis]
MADNEGMSPETTENLPAAEEDRAAGTGDVPSSGDTAPGAELSVAELREWLRRWVADATGQSVDKITVDRPMEEFGLASRDALALGGEIEELTGVVLNATVVWQHPTIASLADVIVNGPPEVTLEALDDQFYTAGYVPGDAHDIAIVGLSTRLPGAGNTPESTWEFLINGGDAIRDLPEGRWAEFLSEPQVAAEVAAGNVRGGYLDQRVVTDFDAEFFAMSPIEVERIDPQQRLVMELTWEALEHARIPASELRGESVGVYIGTSTNDFQLIAAMSLGETDPNVPASAEAYKIMGSASSIIANRVSYFYDFRGPSLAVDTACSSTLVAVHQAVQALRAGDADVALAGGVNMLLIPMTTLGFDSIGAVAKDGRIKAFSADADGMVRSEGAGLVVLKRLADAEHDGDNILAVIKGSAVNSDGRSNGLVAPNPDAQADVLRRAYRDAGIVPSTVDYIEAHGTGTLIGDPIEADALGRVVGAGRAADAPALLGSAKTNFGHLESGAGAASLAKVLLAFQHDVLPANINYAGPNPYIPFEQARLKVVDEPTPFPRYSGTATVGISGFGFGGTNAHVVVQEYVPAAPVAVSEPFLPDADSDTLEVASTDVVAEAEAVAADAAPEPEWSADRAEPLPVILAVSAYLPSRRRRAAADLADWLETEAGQRTPLADVARSLAKRSHWRSRGVVLAKDHTEAVAGLRAIAAGKPGQGVFTADSPAAQGPMWVMAGFGAQHRKMGKQLYQENSIFRRTVDEVDELVQDESGYSVREMILDDAQDYDVGTSQVGIFTVQLGLAALLRAHGAEPAAVVGHSMGEVAGAYICGGLPLEDAVRTICARSRLMGEGEQMLSDADVRNMALVEMSADEVAALLPEFPDVEVAVYAAPTNTVIGGPVDQVSVIVGRVEAAGKFARVLQTKGAGHTSQMDPLLGELAAELAGIEPTKLKVGLYSTVDKEQYYAPGHDPVHNEDYWVKNMRHSVYFTNAVKLAVDSGITTFLELAPNSVALMQVLGTTFAAGLPDAQLIPTLKRKEDESAGVIAALAQLYVHGHPVDLGSLVPDGPYADIPRTAFVRKPYWPKVSGFSAGGNTRAPGVSVALPDGRHVWEVQAASVDDLPTLVRSAATQVLAEVNPGASVAYAPLPASGSLTTTLTPHPGGASIQVHARDGAQFRLLFDAVVTSGSALPVPAEPAARPAAPALTESEVVETVDTAGFGDRWKPDSGQTVEERLALIVAESMGYAVEDLPMEIPLMELGLDSLMAMRIKNRVEYEFDIPQLQVSAVRDASLHEVGKVLHYAIEHRDQVQEMADQQASGESGALSVDDDFVNAAKAAMESGEDPVAALNQATGGVVESSTTTSEPATQESPVAPKAEPAPAAGAALFGGGAAASDEDNVPPRDAAERLTYASWATITGESAGGIFNTLPILDEDTAEKLAARLTERVGAEVTVDDVLDSETIEQLADVVRTLQDSGADVDGFVRPIRARGENSDAVPVFVFHPAGGNTLVYEPLLKRLPEGTPMYGFERVEGAIEERAREYVPELRKLQGEGPYVLYGWSLGAVLAMAVAQILRAEGADVRLVGLIDLAIPAEPENNSPQERLERMRRYQVFAKKTFNIAGELDDDQLRELADSTEEEQFKMITDLIKMTGAKIPGGVLEHQKTSWVESRELQRVRPSHYDGDVVLYLADRYHDGAIELEPRFADRRPNGGWDEYLPNLDIVRIPGDHLQIIDEPRIGRIGADLTAKLAQITSSAAGKGRK